MKRSFDALRAKLQSADAVPSPFAGTAVLGGAARVPARQQTLPASNKIDHAFPTVTGFVVAAKLHPKAQGLMCIEMVTTNVTSPEAASSDVNLVFKLPSGTFTPATMKVQTDDAKLKMVAKPHCMPSKFVLLPLTGVVSFTVTTKGQGTLGGDLTVADLPVGREIEAMRFSYDLKRGADGSPTIYCNADTISFLRSAPFVTEAQQFIVDKAFSCPDVHREVVMNVARATGEFHQEPLFEFLKQDAAALKGQIEKLKDGLSGVRVGQGMALECDALSSDAIESMDSVIKLCTTTMHLGSTDELPPNAQCDIIDLVARNAAVDISRQRIAPFLQSAIDPHTKKLLNCDNTGVGPKCFEFCDARNENAEWTKDFNFFSEALVKSTKSSDDKSIGAFEVDIKAVAICMKNPVTDKWVDIVPQLSSGESLCLAQVLLSAQKAVAPSMQMYDYARLPSLTNTLLPYSAILATTAALGLRATKCTDVQPLISGDFGGVYPYENLISYISGIVNTGVLVSVPFLKANFCDDQDDFIVGPTTTLYAYSAKGEGGTPSEPSKPRFDATGYANMTAFPETRLAKYSSGTKGMPKNSGGTNFYAIYSGVADDVANTPEINTDAAKGDAALKKIMDAQGNLDAWRAKMTIYAVAFSKEGSETTEAATASSAAKPTVADGNTSD